MAAYALGGLPLAFVLYGASVYLSRVLGASQELIGKVLWLPPLGWEIGYFFWGWLSDRAQRTAASAIGAYGVLMAAATLLSLPLALTPLAASLGPVMFLLTFAMFVAAGFVILSVGYATRVFSVAHAGLIAGLGAGSWGAAVALAMPLLGRLFDQGRYSLAFLLAALAPLAGFAVWRLVNRSTSSG